MIDSNGEIEMNPNQIIEAFDAAVTNGESDNLFNDLKVYRNICQLTYQVMLQLWSV